MKLRMPSPILGLTASSPINYRLKLGNPTICDVALESRIGLAEDFFLDIGARSLGDNGGM